MRDGIPFTSRVISDGTLRVLALLTLLHDPRHRGLICFEEPENGVHPARIKQLIGRLQEIVTAPQEIDGEEVPMPLNSNSHSPVVLSDLIDKERHPVDSSILFSDLTTVSDPGKVEQRRKTRLHPVRPKMQPGLYPDGGLTTRDHKERLINETPHSRHRRPY